MRVRYDVNINNVWVCRRAGRYIELPAISKNKKGKQQPDCAREAHAAGIFTLGFQTRQPSLEKNDRKYYK
jgi:hypothetical protein